MQPTLRLNLGLPELHYSSSCTQAKQQNYIAFTSIHKNVLYKYGDRKHHATF